MDRSDWKDKRIAEALFRAPKTPTDFETEAFVSRVMGRIEEARSPALQWLTGRWTVPALGLGIAAVFLATFLSTSPAALTFEGWQAADETPGVLVLTAEEEP
ncbi:MAG: hypothetical protein HY077_18230 [Elusimicrobia bacterium]|nr:hypothetical protein [Elusimicrobiota bacterium]